MPLRVFGLSCISVFLLFFGSGCKKDGSLGPDPHIEYVSVSSKNLTVGDSLVVTIAYEDLEGDLGASDFETKNLFLVDQRDQIEIGYNLKQLDPGTGEIHIKGELDILVSSVFLLDSDATEETLSYEIYLIDREGNRSNRVLTDNISIVK